MTPTDALTCQELVELVTDYLEGTLTPGDHQRFAAHLSGCPGCQLYLDQMRKTIVLAGHLTEASIPTEARDSLLQLFRDWKRDQ